MNQIESMLKDLKARHAPVASGLFYANPKLPPAEWWNHERCNDPPPWNPSVSAGGEQPLAPAASCAPKLSPTGATTRWQPKPIHGWPYLLAATGLSSSLDPIDEMMMLVLRVQEGEHRAYLVFRCDDVVDGWAITGEHRDGIFTWMPGSPIGRYVTDMSAYFTLRLTDMHYLAEPFADLGNLADAMELHRPRD